IAMQKCPELSRLPKASRQLRSLNFKKQDVGTILPPLQVAHSEVLDPSHPAARIPRARMRSGIPGMGISVLPKALMYPRLREYGDAPPPTKSDAGQLGASVHVMVPVAKFPSAVIRNRVMNRVKAAVALVVTRGARTNKDAKGQDRIVFREADAGRDWIRDDWTYIFNPMPEVYRMPQQKLVERVRKMMKWARTCTAELEQSWARKPSKSQTRSGQENGRAITDKHIRRPPSVSLVDLLYSFA
ncbi:uncharacterized protein B0H18DRAFT_877439, partial [Fomitopsis serialis]|uniref:uncharacterized protein n=1 Tax=Fomitopsis serialis TaxID=139415 RepID=UPI0020086767